MHFVLSSCFAFSNLLTWCQHSLLDPSSPRNPADSHVQGFRAPRTNALHQAQPLRGRPLFGGKHTFIAFPTVHFSRRKGFLNFPLAVHGLYTPLLGCRGAWSDTGSLHKIHHSAGSQAFDLTATEFILHISSAVGDRLDDSMSASTAIAGRLAREVLRKLRLVSQPPALAVHVGIYTQ